MITLWGTSHNAVMRQLFTAFALYLLLACPKEQMKLGWSLFRIQRKLRAYAYTRPALQELLAIKSHHRHLTTLKDQSLKPGRDVHLF